MSTLATRLEKIEAQTNDTAKYTRIIGDAIRQIIMEDTDAGATLRTARDQLATIASQYDVSAQYWLNAAAVMLGEVEPPRLTIDAAKFGCMILASNQIKRPCKMYEHPARANP